MPKPMQKHMSLVRIPVNCCADTAEFVNKYCFVHMVWGPKQNKTVFDEPAGELIGLLVEILAGVIVYTTEMFQPVTPFARSQVYVEDVGASMEKQRFELLSSARLPPETSGIRRMCQIFDVDPRPVPNGTSCSVCELRPSWQLESQPILASAACLLHFHPVLQAAP